MIVGPRYNDVDPAVEAAYQRAAEAETVSRIDAIAARLEARRALPCEVCDDGEECACCAVDREFAEVVAVVRQAEKVAEYLRTTDDKTVQTSAWLALAAAFDRLEETDV